MRRPQPWLPKTRGATLVEVLVASTVLLLILGSAVTAFANYSRYVRRVRARADIQQQSMVLMSALSADLGETNHLRIFSQAGSNCVIFPQPRGPGGDLAPVDPSSGQLTWGRVVCYRVDASRNLLRQIEGLPTPWPDVPPDVLSLPVPRDKAYFEALGSVERQFRGEVTRLEVTPGASTSIELTMSVTVNGRTFELDNSSQVAPRN